MGRMQINYGIYRVKDRTAYYMEGYYHEESREEMAMSLKLQLYLGAKGRKFEEKYGIREYYFILGKDPDHHVEVIAIAHPQYDFFDPEIGENIIIGRIKRMRGEIRTPYDLNRRYPDGTRMYPFIYKLEREIELEETDN